MSEVWQARQTPYVFRVGGEGIQIGLRQIPVDHFGYTDGEGPFEKSRRIFQKIRSEQAGYVVY
ncbi:MAG: hypothetical protein AB1345_05680 [Chloroflexota bacterium]